MTFVRWGVPTLFWSCLVLAWAVWLMPAGLPRYVVAGVAALLVLFILNFFRNPSHTPEGGAHSLIAPGEGVVADITEVDEPLFVGERCVRIGIFLSVFDVHVNRSPCPGIVRFATYRPGNFLDARHPDVCHANEANLLGIEADPSLRPGLKLLITQLSGLIARRIICTHGVGDRLERAELFGMIKFGSRTELFIPLSAKAELKIKVGDKVVCGKTVIADVPA
jgi:phosphatidylserine decarboxylase